MAHAVKNPPTKAGDFCLRRFLGRENPLEEEMVNHSRILAWKILTDRGAWRATVHGVAKSWTQLSMG